MYAYMHTYIHMYIHTSYMCQWRPHLYDGLARPLGVTYSGFVTARERPTPLCGNTRFGLELGSMPWLDDTSGGRSPIIGRSREHLSRNLTIPLGFTTNSGHAAPPPCGIVAHLGSTTVRQATSE